MLFNWLTSCDDDRPAIVTSTESKSWHDLRMCIERQLEELSALGSLRIGVRLPATCTGIATLAALDRLGCHVFLIDDQQLDEVCLRLAETLDLDAVLSWQRGRQMCQRHGASESAPAAVPGGVTLLTSGTEGPPKAVVHTWETLARPVRHTDLGASQSWALCYRVHLYAGLQVMLQALLNHGKLVILPPDAQPQEIAELLADHQVGFISATPSYVRRLLLFCDRELLTRVPLQQITMGGEVVDQAVLNGVQIVFPNARIVHIYATSELGRCFSVTDAKEGFPKRFLESEALQGVQLRVIDGELFVRSVNSMIGYDADSGNQDNALQNSSALKEPGWRATGDLVEVGKRRVLFAGRRGEMINVGGNKVRPVQVERVIRTVEGVSDVRVFGRQSSLAGELVACEIVLAAGADVDAVRHSVAERCASALTRYEIPRMIEVVEKIETSTAGKVSRSLASGHE